MHLRRQRRDGTYYDEDHVSGTTSVRDRKDLLTSHELTRRLIDAEAAFRAAKYEAVAAGVDILSELQTSVLGKGNDVDLETGSGRPVGDLIVQMDRGKIERWIEGVERAKDAGCQSTWLQQPALSR